MTWNIEFEQALVHRATKQAFEEESQRPGVLFHYRSAAATPRILEEQIVRATHLRDMKDGQELEYTYGLIREELASLGSTSTDEAERAFCQAVLMDYAKWDENLSAFAFCLSSPGEDGEIAWQWLEYAEQARGFVIQFHTALIEPQPVHRDAPPPVLLKVVYDEAAQRQLVRAAIRETAHYLAKGATPDELRGPLFARLSSVAIRVKHPSFKKEEEWRVAIVLTPDHSSVIALHEDGNRRFVPIRLCPRRWEDSGLVRKLLIGANSNGRLDGRDAREWLDARRYHSVPSQPSHFYFG